MTDTPGIGHNMPPVDLVGRSAALIETVDRWTAERPKIIDAEMAGVAQELLAQLRANRDDLETQQKSEREPFDLAIAAVRIRYRIPLEALGIAITKMRDKLSPWLKREQDRLDAEAAERARVAEDAVAQARAARDQAAKTGRVEDELAARRAEHQLEEARASARTPPRRARAKGDLGSRAATLHATHFAVVVDETQALKSYTKEPAVRTAALIVATRLASALARECKGDPARCPAGFEFKMRQVAS